MRPSSLFKSDAPNNSTGSSTESTQVSSPFVNLIILIAQCGQLLQLLYMGITIVSVRSSRKRVFMGNNVFLHKFYTTRQDPKFHSNGNAC